MMQVRHSFNWWYIALLLAANLVLLLPDASFLRVIGALLLIGLLPGLPWTQRLLASSTPMLRWVTAAALSYTFTCFILLLIHYMSGPIRSWQIVAGLNALAVLPLILSGSILARAGDIKTLVSSQRPPSPRIMPLVLILLIALFLRATNLGFSEFQGDEALALITAAEALEGHEDALFLRSKGPAEVLLPMALWRLTGTINEPIARLPFTIATFWAILTIYLIGHRLEGGRVGWLAAGFFALNGFMVAFGRIVQYQSLVVWYSALAFLLAYNWQQDRRDRLAGLSGLFLGTGLLAHYDAILVLPAVAWLFISPLILISTAAGKPSFKTWVKAVRAGLAFLLAFGASSALFYLPFALDPQANQTGDYVGQRIGRELRNNLPDFFHFNTFYSSSYYIIFTGLLIVGLFAWILWQGSLTRRLATLLVLGAVLLGTFLPTVFAGPEGSLNLTMVPFALMFVGVIFALPFTSGRQALVIWLAVPFLGYNFIVALGLTHIYTIVPAWSLLAAVGWNYLVDRPARILAPRWANRFVNGLLAVGLLGITIFLWNAFVRNDVEYWQDYPEGNLSFFWTPYEQPPEAGFFGFAHRAGWKAIGQKIVDGDLPGDYGSNEEPEITTWYTRGAPRACDQKPEFYILADDLIDPVKIPTDIIATDYVEIGELTLPNQKQMQIMQQLPNETMLNPIDEVTLAGKFDRTATPQVFARSARGSLPAEANFGNQIRLIGYDLDIRRAQPGGRIPVTLYWQALTSMSTGYQVFTHLESASGPIAQSDGVPVCWTYPTNDWRPGQIIADQHAILLAPETQPGPYPLEIGLYLPDTFERLDVLDEAGNPAGTSVTLTTVEIAE